MLQPAHNAEPVGGKENEIFLVSRLAEIANYLNTCRRVKGIVNHDHQR
jgi:hypothetical protein